MTFEGSNVNYGRYNAQKKAKIYHFQRHREGGQVCL